MMGRTSTRRKMVSQGQKRSVHRGSDLNMHTGGDNEEKFFLCMNGKKSGSGFTRVLRRDELLGHSVARRVWHPLHPLPVGGAALSGET